MESANVKLMSVITEVAYTRDVKIPLSADDPEMDGGWRYIPVRPTNHDGDGDGWEIFDETDPGDSAKCKTGWRRSVLVSHEPQQ